jgi:hypothetical protein
MLKKHNGNPLIKFFESNKGHLIHKWVHYFDIYHAYFNKFRNTQVVVLEFGVSHGGSLQMWKNYFGNKSRIIGVDINPECQKLEETQIEIHIGSQDDVDFLKQLMEEIGQVDIVIDDGGHTMHQQLSTLQVTYPYVKEGGIYLAEDLHTSYWHEFGGGLRKQGTFIEKSKELVDQLNAWHSRDTESLRVDDFTKSTFGVHFYDSIVVFEKANINAPYHRQIGVPTIGLLENWDYRNTTSSRVNKKAK